MSRSYTSFPPKRLRGVSWDSFSFNFNLQNGFYDQKQKKRHNTWVRFCFRADWDGVYVIACGDSLIGLENKTHYGNAEIWCSIQSVPSASGHHWPGFGPGALLVALHTSESLIDMHFDRCELRSWSASEELKTALHSYARAGSYFHHMQTGRRLMKSRRQFGVSCT
jgi:hypothetical protein